MFNMVIPFNFTIFWVKISDNLVIFLTGLLHGYTHFWHKIIQMYFPCYQIIMVIAKRPTDIAYDIAIHQGSFVINSLSSFLHDEDVLVGDSFGTDGRSQFVMKKRLGTNFILVFQTDKLGNITLRGTNRMLAVCFCTIGLIDKATTPWQLQHTYTSTTKLLPWR